MSDGRAKLLWKRLFDKFRLSKKVLEKRKFFHRSKTVGEIPDGLLQQSYSCIPSPTEWIKPKRQIKSTDLEIKSSDYSFLKAPGKNFE